MNWSTPYLGLSDADCNCWGLTVRVYRAELGICLPDYSGPVSSSAERAEITALVEQSETNCWRRLSDQEPRHTFDLAAFNRGPIRQHVGVLIDPFHMLHMDRRAIVQPVSRPPWGGRLNGFYRHVQSPFEKATT